MTKALFPNCPEVCTLSLMTATAGFTEVRDRFSEILDQVETTGEAFVITRHSRAAAVLVSVDEYEALLESLNVLSDEETMSALAEADQDISEDRLREIDL